MVKITYIEPNGADREVEVPEGWNLMEAATRNGIDGIDAECGGSCTCATCHVYIDERFIEQIGAPSVAEDEMLDCVADERRANSRLSCQVEVTAGMDGMVVTMPEFQF